MSSRLLKDMPSRRLQVMSSRRLQDFFSVTIFLLSRHRQDVLKTSSSFKPSSRDLEDVLEDVKLLLARRIEVVFKICIEDVLKTSSRQTIVCWESLLCYDQVYSIQ